MSFSALRNFVRSQPRLKRAIIDALEALLSIKRAVASTFSACVRRCNPAGFHWLEKLCVSFLDARIRWRIRTEWYESDHPPHWSYSNYGAFFLAFSDRTGGAAQFYRGFMSSVVVQPGDDVLDIGCGDGFFSKRFLAENASRVDAIDLEEDAIAMARQYNADPKVNYLVQNAVSEPFPQAEYDVIVWDGAIGHFGTETNNNLLSKIKQHLKSDGVFVGSESLADDKSADHLQVWYTLDEVAEMFKKHFPHVYLTSTEYFYDLDRSATRKEFYWRCSNSETALERSSWQAF